jgi:hypothetical protein
LDEHGVANAIAEQGTDVRGGGEEVGQEVGAVVGAGG